MTDKTPKTTTEKVEEHLRSIRNMLTFFTIILVFSLIFQFIGAFFSILGM
jgi:hypothetical protein